MNDLTAQNRSRPSNLVQTIERVDLILGILGQTPQGISVGELSRKVGFPKGTTHRLLSSLAYFDFVRQDSGTKNYHLGFKLMELGNRLLNQIDFRTEARPFLVELADKTGETVHMVILDQDEVLYIDKVESTDLPSGLRMVSMLGSRLPAHCSSVGKVLLAWLPEKQLSELIEKKGLARRTENTITDHHQLRDHLKQIRESGYAIDNEENEIGIRCVGAPIRNQRGEVIAAISISVPAIRAKAELLETSLKDHVTAAALKISNKLGYQGR